MSMIDYERCYQYIDKELTKEPPVFEIQKERQKMYRVCCRYGLATITYKENLIRFTVSKKRGYASHLIAKYDKYNKFRVYQSTIFQSGKTQVRDVTLSFFKESPFIINKMLNKVSLIKAFDYSLSSIIQEKFNEFFKKAFGEEYSFYFMFPLLEENQVPRQFICNYLSGFLRCKTPKELAIKIFGNPSRTLIKSVAELCPLNRYDICNLLLAKSMSKIWAVEHIIKFLSKEYIFKTYNDTGIISYEGHMPVGVDFFFISSYNSYKKNCKGINISLKEYATIFSNFSAKKIINWRKKYKTSFYNLMKDTVSQIKEIHDHGYELNISSRINLKQLHDRVSIIFKKLKKTDHPLPVIEDIYNTTNNKKISDMKIIFPRTYYELKEISNTLHNCVSAYSSFILNGSSSIVIITRKKVPTYCIEAKIEEGKFKVVQFLGKYNSSPVEEDKLLVEKYFKDNFVKKVKKNLIIPENHKLSVINISEEEKLSKEILIS